MTAKGLSAGNTIVLTNHGNLTVNAGTCATKTVQGTTVSLQSACGSVTLNNFSVGATGTACIIAATNVLTASNANPNVTAATTKLHATNGSIECVRTSTSNLCATATGAIAVNNVGNCLTVAHADTGTGCITLTNTKSITIATPTSGCSSVGANGNINVQTTGCGANITVDPASASTATINGNGVVTLHSCKGSVTLDCGTSAPNVAIRGGNGVTLCAHTCVTLNKFGIFYPSGQTNLHAGGAVLNPTDKACNVQAPTICITGTAIGASGAPITLTRCNACGVTLDKACASTGLVNVTANRCLTVAGRSHGSSFTAATGITLATTCGKSITVDGATSSTNIIKGNNSSTGTGVKLCSAGGVTINGDASSATTNHPWWLMHGLGTGLCIQAKGSVTIHGSQAAGIATVRGPARSASPSTPAAPRSAPFTCAP